MTRVPLAMSTILLDGFASRSAPDNERLLSTREGKQ
jgi:hypothetical protein